MKYEILVIQEIDSSHQLKLPYKSGCNNLHGHRWRFEVCIECDTLNDQGMVVDFQHIKQEIKKIDHTHLNAWTEPPTAENIAYAMMDAITVFLQRSEFGNKHAFIKYITLFETPSGSVTIWP